MTRLIIHVGPGKCGSSSIQDFFVAQKKPCIEKTSYSLLSAIAIDRLEKPADYPKAPNYFQNVLSKHLRGDNCAILSHEYLFQTPLAVSKICQLAEQLTDEISIIGYCRQQSGFIASQYSQWLFRDTDRVAQINKNMGLIGLDWQLFTGLERQFIASIYDDFESARMLGDYQALNWNESYQRLEEYISNKNINVFCGVLPSRDSKKTLIDDFCEKAKLTLLPEAKNVENQVSNVSFSNDIVEAINNAILHDYKMPGPHTNNNLIESLSSGLRKNKQQSDFMDSLKAYVDGYYWESNKQHCQRYSLDHTYFAKPTTINKSQIIDIILKENEHRKQNPAETMDRYRELNAKLIKLCLELSNKSQ